MALESSGGEKLVLNKYVGYCYILQWSLIPSTSLAVNDTSISKKAKSLKISTN